MNRMFLFYLCFNDLCISQYATADASAINAYNNYEGYIGKLSALLNTTWINSMLCKPFDQCWCCQRRSQLWN